MIFSSQFRRFLKNHPQGTFIRVQHDDTQQLLLCDTLAAMGMLTRYQCNGHVRLRGKWRQM